MRSQIDWHCAQHDDPYDCPDALVIRFPDGRFVLPVRNGGTAFSPIAFCPWCGADLGH